MESKNIGFSAKADFRNVSCYTQTPMRKLLPLEQDFKRFVRELKKDKGFEQALKGTSDEITFNMQFFPSKTGSLTMIASHVSGSSFTSPRTKSLSNSRSEQLLSEALSTRENRKGLISWATELIYNFHNHNCNPIGEYKPIDTHA